MRLNRWIGVAVLLCAFATAGAAGRSYFPDMSQEEFEKKVGSMIAGVDPKRVEVDSVITKRDR